MKCYLKSALPFVLVVVIASSCNTPSIEEKSIEQANPDTTAAKIPEPVVPLKATLKETVLNEKTLITGKRLYNAPKIDDDKFKLLSIKLIDSSGNDDNGFKYHIIDTLFTGAVTKILLIGREYESENAAWIAVYDHNNKLLDHKTVYYDNAEGFMSIETIIKNNQLSITTYNEYAEKEKDKKTTALYQLNENNKIVKL